MPRAPLTAFLLSALLLACRDIGGPPGHSPGPSPSPSPKGFVLRLEADTYAVTVGAPAQFSAAVTSEAGTPIAGVPVRWSTFFLVSATSIGYDTIWDRPLEPPATTTDAQGRATISYAFPLGIGHAVTTAARWSRLVARLENGAADTAQITATIPAESPSGLQWSGLPAVPWSRADMAAAAHGNRIFLLGGYCQPPYWVTSDRCGATPGQPVAFTPATGAWDVLPLPDSLTLPTRGGLAADLPDGIHLLAAGRHLLYVPETGQWSARTAPWPDTLLGPAVLAAVQGRLYAVSETGALRIYDPATDAWSGGSALPRPPGRGAPRPAAGVLGDQIYVAGGGGYFDQGRQLTRYDPPTDTWTALPDMPFGRSDMGAGAVAGRFCVFGGGLDTWVGWWPFDETYCYDPSTKAWLLGPPPAGPVGYASGGMAAVTLGDRVYAFGGAFWFYKSGTYTNAGTAVLAPR